jgi:hypothetical protein
MCGAKTIRQLRLACGFAAISLVGMATPAYAETTSVSAETVVVTPLSFNEVKSLNFGEIIPSNQAGNVILAPNGTRTATNGITLVGDSHQVAEFAGFGARNQIVEISVGATNIFLTGRGTRMRVRNFTIGSTPTVVLNTQARSFRIINPAGVFQFPVGAELRVGANQRTGTYTGTWDITLNYQ